MVVTQPKPWAYSIYPSEPAVRDKGFKIFQGQVKMKAIGENFEWEK